MELSHRYVISISLVPEMTDCRSVLVLTGFNPMARSNLAVVGHAGPTATGEALSSPHALAAFAALGQPTRLSIVRLLMRSEPDGLPAGSIAEAIGCPHNTLSTHLAILARAGLVQGTRDGRAIIYRADIEGMRALVSFLITDCCDGHPELCGLGKAAASDCCPPPAKARKRKR
jgi:ArsR family transcriptional regulator, arsenate/arsenite/antimonite-responsive transcriptional repressor